MDFTDLVKSAVNTQFLDEPIWRWALFAGAMIAIGSGWRAAIDFMK